MTRITPLAIALALFATSAGAQTIEDTVAALGRINGTALACGHADVVARAKSLVIARVAKTRALGEAFENATNAAFAAATGGSSCPQRAPLAVELEVAAARLGPPATHANTETAEAPDTGINPRYLLQDVNGRAIMDSDFPQQFQLIAFGYTFCPDVCPTTLLEMAEVLKALGDDAALLKPIFVSVDPARDTLPALRQYTGYFDTRITGATANPDLVRRAADNFKVRYEKVVDPKTDPAHYAVDHTAGMYLLAPGGGFLARFAYRTPVEAIVARLKDEFKARPNLRPAAK